MSVIGWTRRFRGHIPWSHATDDVPATNFSGFLHLCEEELIRARRYRHPVSLVTVSVEIDPNGADPRQTQLAAGEVGGRLRATLAMRVRESDVCAFDPARARWLVALPQTDRLGARGAATRINQAVGAPGATRLKFGVAVFPQDGLTVDDLIRSAVADAHGVRRVDARIEPETAPGRNRQNGSFLAEGPG
jgi:hypothetical protein